MSNGEGTPEAEAALDALFREVLTRSVQRTGNPVVERARIDLALKLRTLHATRLSLAADRTDELKWLILLILGVVAQLAIAVVHLERPRPQIGALAIFSAAVVIALGLVAIRSARSCRPLKRLSPIWRTFSK